MLAKPQTFMNASGESVGQLVSYFKIPLNQVVVMYDDLDLPFAKLRLLPKGGHGGHNGMRSIINHLKQSRDFPRLRIGIGRPPGKMDPANFVLRPFTKREQEEVFTIICTLEILWFSQFNKDILRCSILIHVETGKVTQVIILCSSILLSIGAWRLCE
uniref:peptidyl-tRNA hydrolase n=1 Tax=Setaria italica TaxID=4555 RepID=K3XMS7_SETIT